MNNKVSAFEQSVIMKNNRTSRTSRLLRQLRHLIHADSQRWVRRRDLLSAREGEVQLELDLVSARPVRRPEPAGLPQVAWR